jgi:hypothetical protein
MESWRRGETQQVKKKERGSWGVGQKEKRKRRKMEDDEWLERGPTQRTPVRSAGQDLD